ncbi:MAG: kelch repeat-containing protein [Blastocatellia bacterium]|nr:kelch repeat-containing protein [Blastocatellia bacterium]
MMKKYLLACWIVVGILHVAAGAQTSSWQWRQIAAETKPEARRNGVMIHDPIGKRLILFGGSTDSGPVNDAWAFGLETRAWTKLATTGPTPPARHSFDAVYDPVDRQMVIYAGQGAGFFNDTWALRLDTLEWRDLSPASNGARPKARYGSTAVFDPVTRSLVQFAGFTSESGRFQDTQSFSIGGRSWVDWTPAGAKPQVRCLLTSAFDRANRRMVIYGGQRSGTLDDIWSFDLAQRTWTNLTPAQRPAGRWFTTSFFDREGRFVIFGGYTSAGNANDLWSFDLAARQWTRLEVADPPSPRNGSMAVFLEEENRLLLFGGSADGGLTNDLWELRRETPATVSVVSAASFAGQALAAESIVAAFGTNLATGTQVASAAPLPESLAGTTVRIRDAAGTERAAPLFFVSPTQLNFLVPAGLVAGTVTVTVASGNGATALGTAQIANVAPGLFSADAAGQGIAAAVALRVRNGAQTVEPIARFDAAQNRFVPVPIDLGPEGDQVFLILFGTGFRYRSALSTVAARIGGLDAPVFYAGPQNELAGLDQLNLALPRALAGRGDVEITLAVDGLSANAVRVRIQ